MLMIFIISLLMGCKSVPPPETKTETKTVKTIKIIERDTIVKIEKDSAFYRSFIQCVNNKPVLVKSSIQKSKNSKIIPVVKLQDSVLNVGCYSVARELYLKWKEKYISEHTTEKTVITLPPKLIEKQLSWWQKLWIALGKILLLIIIGYLVTKISWKNLLGLFVRLLRLKK